MHQLTRPGQIVILNGAPRSGKSSIVNAIQETFEGLWMNLGVDRFKDQVKIYATDVDSEALMQAGTRATPSGRSPAYPRQRWRATSIGSTAVTSSTRIFAGR